MKLLCVRQLKICGHAKSQVYYSTMIFLQNLATYNVLLTKVILPNHSVHCYEFRKLSNVLVSLIGLDHQEIMNNFFEVVVYFRLSFV